MVINKINNKKFIELTEDKLILYRRFYTSKIKLENINSIYLDINKKLVIILNKGFKRINIDKVKNIAEVEALIDKIDKKDRIYVDSNFDLHSVEFLIVVWTLLSILNIIEQRWNMAILGIIMIAAYLRVLKFNSDKSRFIYDINSKTITFRKWFKFNTLSIYDDFKFSYEKINRRYMFKKDNIKIPVKDVILYPKCLKEELDKLCN